MRTAMTTEAERPQERAPAPDTGSAWTRQRDRGHRRDALAAGDELACLAGLFIVELGLRTHDPALCSCMSDTFARALDEQLALPLGHRRHDVDDHLVGGMARVEGGVDHLHVDLSLGEVGDRCHRLVGVAA